MKTLPILFVLMMCAVTTAHADNLIVLKDGTELRNIWLLNVGYDNVTVWHQGREEVIKQDLLPDVERAKIAPAVEELNRRADETEAAHQARLAVLKRGGKLTTVTGKTYEGVSLSDVKPDCITILHSTGSARIGLEDLSVEIRQSLKGDIAGAQMTAEALAKQRDKDPAQQEWRKVAKSPGAFKRQQLSVVIIQQLNDGAIVERVGSAQDITPGVKAYIGGLRHTLAGMWGKINVVRAGVWWDSKEKGWVKYSLQLDKSGVIQMTTRDGMAARIRPQAP